MMASPLQKRKARMRARQSQSPAVQEATRLLWAKKRAKQIPDGVLRQLANMHLPPHKRAYTAALKSLLVEQGD